MKPILISCLFSVALGVFTPPVNTQTFQCMETLDSVVAQSDHIVIGQIERSGKTHNDIYGHVWTEVDLKIVKMLYGKPARELHINLASAIMPATSENQRPRKLSGTEDSLLVMVQSERGESRWPQLARFVDLDATEISLWSADFKVLTDKAAIIKTAKNMIQRLKQDPQSGTVVCLDKPKENFAGTYLAETMTRGLYIPADKRMEDRAKATISGELAPSYGENSRLLAVEALGNRRSDENIALLRKLLHSDSPGLRWGAFEALKKMGENVDEPN